MQSSREIVLNTLEHKAADRIPVGYMHILPEVAEAITRKYDLHSYEEVLELLGLDYRKLKVPYLRNPPDELREEYRKRYDKDWPEQDVRKPFFLMQPFGVETEGSYSGAISNRPFAEIDSVKPIESYPWPDPLWLDYDAIAAEMDLYPDKAIIAPDWSPVWGAVCEFFGMENALANLLLQPKLVDATIERVMDYYIGRDELLFEKCKGRFDIYLFGDDFASDRGLLFSLETWRRFFKHPTKKRIDLAKSHGLKVHNHCCGVMHELIPEFIDMGIDELEPCQFHLSGMSAERMSREFGRHITFYGGIDTQKTIPFGTPEEVRKKVRDTMEVFPGGGYAVGSDHTLLPEFPLENTLALYDEAKRVNAMRRR
jgi:uroporphyrinogen decarboxylase